MFTRCKGCHTVHPVNAALLARAGGRYRCSKCNASGNALESLFDEWPDAGEKAPGRGDLPVLGLALDIEEAARSRQDPEGSGITPDDQGRTTKRYLRTAWVTLGVLTLVITIVLALEFSGRPPGQVLEQLGLRDPLPAETFRDPDQIHLVSRELRPVPGTDRLRLSATIVNRADRKQAFPDIEVVLLDRHGGDVARHRFGPADYLATGTTGRMNMAPQAYLPLALELPDPGSEAVGFELNFH